MICTTNLEWPNDSFHLRTHPHTIERTHLRLVAFDVEWAKNFRAKNASRAFCYSLACIAFRPVDGDEPKRWHIGLKSLYIDTELEEQALLMSVAQDMKDATDSDCTITGHQLSSDLGVISARTSGDNGDGARVLRELWHARRQLGGRVIDTRYDAGHLLQERSRRLVDVCGELELDVHQPEIRNSMTAMHRTFLETGDAAIRERLVAMNLRHSLSTAIVAMTALGHRKPTPLNVNKLLYESLRDQLGYLNTPNFRALAGVYA
jgi:hypothetical protein